MPDPNFQITNVRADRRGIIPLIAFDLDIENQPEDQFIQSILLRGQIRIESTGRACGDAERERLVELFGRPADWGRTLKDMFWINVDATDDPGKDMGMMRQPGHRFFYGLDEVEPLEER